MLLKLVQKVYHSFLLHYLFYFLISYLYLNSCNCDYNKMPNFNLLPGCMGGIKMLLLHFHLICNKDKFFKNVWTMYLSKDWRVSEVARQIIMVVSNSFKPWYQNVLYSITHILITRTIFSIILIGLSHSTKSESWLPTLPK